MSDFEAQMKAHIEHVEKELPEKKTKGWLTFFLLMIGLGGILTPIIGFANMSLSDYDIGIGRWTAVMGIICESILLLGVAVLAVYTITAFNKFKPNAVRLGMAYLIIVFSTNLLGLIAGDFELTGYNSFSRIITRLTWQAIWVIYLLFSKQVNTLYPKEERKLFKRDKVLLITVIAPLLFWVLLIFASIFVQSFAAQRQMQKYIIDDTNLSFFEYTDGIILFESPLDLTVRKIEEENIFILTKGDEILIYVYGTFDNNDTLEYFEECVQAWSNPSLINFEYSIKNEQHGIKNGNSFYFRTLEYFSDPPIEWTFAMLFNKETGKCCVLSCFSAEETDHLSDVINSIRFK